MLLVRMLVRDWFYPWNAYAFLYPFRLCTRSIYAFDPSCLEVLEPLSLRCSYAQDCGNPIRLGFTKIKVWFFPINVLGLFLFLTASQEPGKKIWREKITIKSSFCLLYHSRVSNRVPLAYRSNAHPLCQCSIVLVM